MEINYSSNIVKRNSSQCYVIHTLCVLFEYVVVVKVQQRPNSQFKHFYHVEIKVINVLWLILLLATGYSQKNDAFYYVFSIISCI